MRQYVIETLSRLSTYRRSQLGWVMIISNEGIYPACRPRSSWSLHRLSADGGIRGPRSRLSQCGQKDTMRAAAQVFQKRSLWGQPVTVITAGEQPIGLVPSRLWFA